MVGGAKASDHVNTLTLGFMSVDELLKGTSTMRRPASVPVATSQIPYPYCLDPAITVMPVSETRSTKQPVHNAAACSSTPELTPWPYQRPAGKLLHSVTVWERYRIN